MSGERDIVSAVIAFREAAIAKGSDGSQSSALDKALHAAMADAVECFRGAGTAGAHALRSLANDTSPEVRTWAAAELLSSGDSGMVPILEDLAARPDLLGFNARIVLQEFEAGRLRSPFPPHAR